MKTLTRIVRAAGLEAQAYEEVEADRGANRGALLVVVLAAVSAGLGLGVGWMGVALLVLSHLAGWVIWATLIYWIGTRLLPEPQTKSNVGQLLRTLGFAASPGILWGLSLIPVAGPYIFWVISVWVLAAVVIAVRQALDFRSTTRAVAVCALGWAVHVIFLSLATVTVR